MLVRRRQRRHRIAKVERGAVQAQEATDQTSGSDFINGWRSVLRRCWRQCRDLVVWQLLEALEEGPGGKAHGQARVSATDRHRFRSYHDAVSLAWTGGNLVAVPRNAGRLLTRTNSPGH